MHKFAIVGFIISIVGALGLLMGGANVNNITNQWNLIFVVFGVVGFLCGLFSYKKVQGLSKVLATISILSGPIFIFFDSFKRVTGADSYPKLALGILVLIFGASIIIRRFKEFN